MAACDYAYLHRRAERHVELVQAAAHPRAAAAHHRLSAAYLHRAEPNARRSADALPCT